MVTAWRRGDVADCVVGSRQIRVVIISKDLYNQREPIVLFVHDRADQSIGNLLIPLPATLGGGTVNVKRMRNIDVDALGHRHGRLAAATMARVEAGLRDLLGL